MANTKLTQVMVKGDILAQKSYSLWGLFTGADFFVQFIMGLLVVGSIVSWAIIFSKVKKIWALRQVMGAFDGENLDNRFLADLKTTETPFGRLVLEADGDKAKGEAFDTKLPHWIRREMRPITQHLSFLATLGSTAPFIGLLGTVWGIMNSFQAIAMTRNTSLDVVAPGMAEALAATALGLIVAIPAVVAYNRIAYYAQEIEERMDFLADHLSVLRK